MLSLATLGWLALTGIAAGALGSLVGIGGGVLLVPALVLLFRVPPQVAVATSLVAVVATSTAAGSVYVGAGTVNMRLGMSLEVATSIGGVLGGVSAAAVSPSVLSAALAALLVGTAVILAAGKDRPSLEGRAPGPLGPSPRAASVADPRGHLSGTYCDERTGTIVAYEARRWPLGAAISLFAGVASGLLGVGGGFLKVPAMALGMGVPLRVAAATSNFMIGVTAVSSLFVYLTRGFVEPFLVAPGVLGVVVGSLAGTRISAKVPQHVLRLLTAIVLLVAAIELGLRGLGRDGHGG